MKIDSEELHKRLNDIDLIEWMDKDDSPFMYKQGYLSGLLRVLCVINEVEYKEKHGYYANIELSDISEETAEELKKLIGKVKEKIEDMELISHSEKDILKCCISLMYNVYDEMLSYMQYMGFEYDTENDEEIPTFRYSYFRIVQRLFLFNTSHSGGTSTRLKCEKLGVDPSDMVVFEPEEVEE